MPVSKRMELLWLLNMNEKLRLLGCRNFRIRPVAIIIGVCRIVELVRDDGETVIATITSKQMNSPLSFFKRLEAIYFETNVWCKWNGDNDMLMELKSQLYGSPMEEIAECDWERWKMLHSEIKMFKLSDKWLRSKNCCIKNKE